MTQNRVKFGPKAYVITRAVWDSATQTAKIAYEDDNGIKFHADALGMAISEQRQAVVDDILRRLRTGREAKREAQHRAADRHRAEVMPQASAEGYEIRHFDDLGGEPTK